MDPKLAAFLTLIGWSEGTTTSPLTQNAGYDIIVTGEDGPNSFTDYSDHPFANGRPAIVVRAGLLSTASGRYQIILPTWRAYRASLSLPDFSPASQDAVALELIKERKAIPAIEADQIDTAISLCSNIWASLPGNAYGQAGGHTMATLVDQYQNLLMA